MNGKNWRGNMRNKEFKWGDKVIYWGEVLELVE